MFERKVNEAGLFPNVDHPDKSDFNGQVDVKCEHCGKTTNFWVNGWRKLAKNSGIKYLSIALRPKKATNNNTRSITPASTDNDW